MQRTVFLALIASQVFAVLPPSAADMVPTVGVATHFDLNPPLSFTPLPILSTPAPPVGGPYAQTQSNFITCLFSDGFNSDALSPTPLREDFLHFEVEIQNPNPDPVAVPLGFLLPNDLSLFGVLGLLGLGSGSTALFNLGVTEIAEVWNPDQYVLNVIFDPFNLPPLLFSVSVTEAGLTPQPAPGTFAPMPPSLTFLSDPANDFFVEDPSVVPQLTFALHAVPEPSTAALIASVATMLLLSATWARKSKSRPGCQGDNENSCT